MNELDEIITNLQMDGSFGLQEATYMAAKILQNEDTRHLYDCWQQELNSARNTLYCLERDCQREEMDP